MLRFALAGLALSASTAAAAHSFWLQPADYTPDAIDEVLIEFKVGDAGDVNDWGLYWERVASMRLYGPEGVRDAQRSIRVTGAGEVGSAVVSVPSPGSFILAFESNPSFSNLEAERFNNYLHHEGLTAIAAHREARGRTGVAGTELYARRAKTLLQAGERYTGNVTQSIGQILEITPLEHPFRLKDGQSLNLQVMWRGKPLEGATLTAAPLGATGKPQSYLTSADGVVSVAAPMDTPMLYSVVWGVPAPNDNRADYFTIFSSLTVARN